MNPSGFRFRLAHLALLVIWISLFFAALAGQGMDVFFAAAIGNAAAAIVPMVACFWWITLRREIENNHTRSSAIILFLLHWRNFFYFLLLAILLFLIAAIGQYCWDFGNLYCGLASLLGFPAGAFIGWRLLVSKRKKPSTGG